VRGEGEEGVLQARGCHRQPAYEARGGQRQHRRVGVGAAQHRAVAAHLQGEHARQPAQALRTGPRQVERHERRADPPLDRLAGAVRDGTAPVQHHDAVGVAVRLLQVVRREQHGVAACRVRPHRAPERAPRLHVQRGGRFVQHQQFGAAGHREREAQPLGLPAGQPVRPPAGQLRDPGELQRLAPRQRTGVRRRDEAHQLLDGGPRHGLALLEHGAHPPGPHRGVRRPAEQLHLAGVGPVQPQQQGDRRRLAGAVAPQQRERLARGDTEVEPSQRLDGPEPLAYRAEPCGFRHGPDAMSAPARAGSAVCPRGTGTFVLPGGPAAGRVCFRWPVIPGGRRCRAARGPTDRRARRVRGGPPSTGAPVRPSERLSAGPARAGVPFARPPGRGIRSRTPQRRGDCDQAHTRQVNGFHARLVFSVSTAFESKPVCVSSCPRAGAESV
jgi:hypothetical protein